MRRLVVLALLLAAPALRAAPDASPELAALVPAETLFLAEAGDLDGKGRFGEETSIGKLLAEPEVKQFAEKLRESFRAAFAQNSRGPLAMFGLTPEDFDGIAIRRAGFAVVAAAPASRQVDAVLYVETRAGGEKVARILQALRQAAETFVGVAFTEADVRGRKVVSTALAGHELSIAAHGDRFVITTKAARMAEVLKAIDEGHPASLRASPRMARLVERMGARKNSLLCYADAPALARLALDAWPKEEEAAEAKRIGAALGLDAVEALGFADVPEGAGYRTEGAVLLKERRGLFALCSGAPPSHRFAKMTPGDALGYGAHTCDLAALWDGILGLAGAIDPKAKGRLEEEERGLGGQLGLDLRKDLLEAFGTEWAGYVAWPPGGGVVPDLVLFATVRDRERVLRALDTLATKAGAAAQSGGASVTARATTFRGAEIRFLEVVDRRGDPRPYAPAWAVGADFVVFGLWPQSVKHALLAKHPEMNSPSVDWSLAGRTDFQQLLAAAPRNAAGATYVDLGRIGAWLYASMVPLLQSVQGAFHKPSPDIPAPVRVALAGVRLNFEDLPTADVVARHLSGVVAYSTHEPDCVRVGFVSQFGAPLAIVPVAALAGAGAAIHHAQRQHARAAASEARRAAEATKAAEERLRGEQAAQAAAQQQAQARKEAAERQAQSAREAAALAEARAKAEAALAANEQLAAEARRLAAENATLRTRLAALEAKVAELLEATEEGGR